MISRLRGELIGVGGSCGRGFSEEAGFVRRQFSKSHYYSLELTAFGSWLCKIMISFYRFHRCV
ncbi:hypothetical protein Leryth_024032 [Lithospermum erythrorhizon]|nr:hypothetical protein Leryth_024032 [Lithospermum erythrorhizon]